MTAVVVNGNEEITITPPDPPPATLPTSSTADPMPQSAGGATSPVSTGQPARAEEGTSSVAALESPQHPIPSSLAAPAPGIVPPPAPTTALPTPQTSGASPVVDHVGTDSAAAVAVEPTSDARTQIATSTPSTVGQTTKVAWPTFDVAAAVAALERADAVTTPAESPHPPARTDPAAQAPPGETPTSGPSQGTPQAQPPPTVDAAAFAAAQHRCRALLMAMGLVPTTPSATVHGVRRIPALSVGEQEAELIHVGVSTAGEPRRPRTARQRRALFEAKRAARRAKREAFLAEALGYDETARREALIAAHLAMADIDSAGDESVAVTAAAADEEVLLETAVAEREEEEAANATGAAEEALLEAEVADEMEGDALSELAAEEAALELEQLTWEAAVMHDERRRLAENMGWGAEEGVEEWSEEVAGPPLSAKKRRRHHRKKSSATAQAEAEPLTQGTPAAGPASGAVGRPPPSSSVPVGRWLPASAALMPTTKVAIGIAGVSRGPTRVEFPTPIRTAGPDRSGKRVSATTADTTGEAGVIQHGYTRRAVQRLPARQRDEMEIADRQKRILKRADPVTVIEREDDGPTKPTPTRRKRTVRTAGF